MAATFVSRISLLQPNPSLSLKPHQSPLFPQQFPSSFRFETKRAKGVVLKASSGVLEVNSKQPISAKKSNDPIIVIDNYDSFTYNLCQKPPNTVNVWGNCNLVAIVLNIKNLDVAAATIAVANCGMCSKYMGELGFHFEVYRNDELTVEELKRKNPRGVLISPGPGEPQDSGISLQTVLELGPTVPVFGVCMGLQCMGEAFGGKIVRAPYGVMHGKSSLVYYDEKGEDGLFAGLPNPFLAARYHSLVIEKESFPHEELEVTAWTEDGLIMAIRHKKYRYMQVTTYSSCCMDLS
ncbi:anthranilate synthase component ii-like protein [Trifolium pratense]|uniref:anthranilate synthase n=1 Tax=Trifolium pratense TaxID=57577 RepID=A0A2K3N1B8_TRIPR|nr:anthranilate synthase component ii-like protein [Trifolium pratense]